MEGLNEQQRAAADAAFATRLNVVHHAYVDIAGDLIAGALLGQVLYWFAPGKDGRSRARIVKEGRLWIAKARADWWDEIRISPKQYDRAARILKDKGLIELKTFKFNGNPTTHIRIKPEAINAALDAWKVEQVKTLLPDGKEPAAAGFAPMGNNDMPETGSALLPVGGFRPIPMDKPEEAKAGISLTETTAERTSREHQESTNTHGANALQAHAVTIERINNDFETVWHEYPRKEGRTKARTAFERAVRGMGTRKPDGAPWNALEILAEVIAFNQYTAARLQAGELEPRFVPTGGAWFDREGWTDETPSISSKLGDFDAGLDYNRNIAAMRKLAREGADATGDERAAIFRNIQEIRSTLPF